MIPSKIQDQINEINQTNSNYSYLSFTKEKLKDLNKNCNKALDELIYYQNQSIINFTKLVQNYQKLDELKKNTTTLTTNEQEIIETIIKSLPPINSIIKEQETIETSKANLLNFKDKINQRIDIITIEPQYSKEEKSQAFQQALDCIEQGSEKNEELEQLLISCKLSQEELNRIVEEDETYFSFLLLIRSIENKNLEAIKMLCEAGAQIETTQDDVIEHEITKLPSITAIEINNPEIIDYLLTKNLNTSLETFDGDTLLKLAIENKNIPLFKKLILEHNVDFNDINGYNLDALITSCNLEALDFVLDNVENLDLNRLVDDTSTPILTKILTNPEFNEDVYQESIKMFEKLVENGYNINATDREGNTVLHYVINPNYKNISQYAETLLRLGANQSIANNKDETPLDLAKTNPDPLIKKLLDNNQGILVSKNTSAPIQNLAGDESKVEELLKNFNMKSKQKMNEEKKAFLKMEKKREEQEKKLTGESVEYHQYRDLDIYSMPSTSSGYNDYLGFGSEIKRLKIDEEETKEVSIPSTSKKQFLQFAKVVSIKGCYDKKPANTFHNNGNGTSVAELVQKVQEEETKESQEAETSLKHKNVL